MIHQRETDPAFDAPEDETFPVVAALLKLAERDCDYKDRGNRDDYVYSQCWKDADLDGISTGILGVSQGETRMVKTRGGEIEVLSALHVRVGWWVTFCSGADSFPEATANAMEEVCQDIVACTNLPGGSWDADDFSWSGTGEDSLEIAIPQSWRIPVWEGTDPKLVEKLWARVLKAFEAWESKMSDEAGVTHEAMEAVYKDAEAGLYGPTEDEDETGTEGSHE